MEWISLRLDISRNHLLAKVAKGFHMECRDTSLSQVASGPSSSVKYA